MEKVRAGETSPLRLTSTVTFQSPWIRFARTTVWSFSIKNPSWFQSPWIRFAPGLLAGMLDRLPPVSIPVDKVRAECVGGARMHQIARFNPRGERTRLEGGEQKWFKLGPVSIPVDKVRAVHQGAVLRLAPLAVSIPVDKVRAWSLVPWWALEEMFQSPWIRFAPHTMRTPRWMSSCGFQSPWIRFAPSIKEEVKSFIVWRVSIPVDKVRA